MIPVSNWDDSIHGPYAPQATNVSSNTAQRKHHTARHKASHQAKPPGEAKHNQHPLRIPIFAFTLLIPNILREPIPHTPTTPIPNPDPVTHPGSLPPPHHPPVPIIPLGPKKTKTYLAICARIKKGRPVSIRWYKRAPCEKPSQSSDVMYLSPAWIPDERSARSKKDKEVF